MINVRNLKIWCVLFVSGVMYAKTEIKMPPAAVLQGMLKKIKLSGFGTRTSFVKDVANRWIPMRDLEEMLNVAIEDYETRYTGITEEQYSVLYSMLFGDKEKLQNLYCNLHQHKKIVSISRDDSWV